MDSYTFNTQPGVATPPHGNSSSRILYLLLILLVILSAAATAYLLMIKKPAPVAPAPLTIKENPFETTPPAVNPFVNTTPEPTAVNPFADTSDDNPFSQFDTGSTTAAPVSDQYQNPF